MDQCWSLVEPDRSLVPVHVSSGLTVQVEGTVQITGTFLTGTFDTASLLPSLALRVSPTGVNLVGP